MKDRPDGPHQIWLQDFLGLPFAEYAFGRDKAIALRLKSYWEEHHSWPVPRMALALNNGRYHTLIGNQIQCPACHKGFTSERGVILHFRQALEGWDPIWDSRLLHTHWAQAKGIKVDEGSYAKDYYKLKEAVKEALKQ